MTRVCFNAATSLFENRMEDTILMLLVIFLGRGENPEPKETIHGISCLA
jgi:hypothetical protein